MPKEYINPEELFQSQQYGFSQIVSTSGGRTVYISGQVGWDAGESMVGPGDLQAQTRQALRNLRTAMEAAGGAMTDVVSLRIYIQHDVIDQDHFVRDGLLEFFPAGRLPAATWIGVPSLSEKEFLIEIEAVAVVE